MKFQIKNIFKRVRNQVAGQVSILAVLLFQVVFVLFLVMINIGLLVHQKIVLQNAVDMAAMYGAQRQAEWLNAIAHINFQLRQNLKLLTFRLRVVGDGSSQRSDYPHVGEYIHPVTKPGGFFQNNTIGNDEDTHHFRKDNIPYVCVYDWKWALPYEIGNAQLEKVTPDNHECQPSRIELGYTRPPSGQSRPLGFIAVDPDVFNRANSVNDKRLPVFNTVNWFYANTIQYAFAQEALKRKKIIRKIVANMQKDPNQMIELNSGKPAGQGIKNTLINNLNLPTIASGNISIDIKNSLEMLKNGRSDLDTQKDWLNEIYPQSLQVVWLDYYDVASLKTKMKSTTAPAINDRFPTSAYPNSFVTRFQHISQDIYTTTIKQELTESNSILLSVEKNPFVNIFTSVKAQVTVKLPFSPFGTITLTAKSNAKPFGGRIGPQYMDNWTSSSSPASVGSKFDINSLAKAQDASVAIVECDTPYTQNRDCIPNYSRYPGDPRGALAVNFLTQMSQLVSPGGANPANVFHLQHYYHLAERNFIEPPPFSDLIDVNHDGFYALADLIVSIFPGDKNTDSAPAIKFIEAAIIAPDVWDSTYYSIDLNFYGNYLSKLGFDILEIGRNKFLGDFGNGGHNQSSEVPSGLNFSDKFSVTVLDQIKVQQFFGKQRGEISRPWNAINPNIGDIRKPFLLDWTHPKEIGFYDTSSSPEYNLTQMSDGCEFPKDSEVNNGVVGDHSGKRYIGGDPNGLRDNFSLPGICAGPGRTGYSVKIVSKDYLENARNPKNGPMKPAIFPPNW